MKGYEVRNRDTLVEKLEQSRRLPRTNKPSKTKIIRNKFEKNKKKGSK